MRSETNTPPAGFMAGKWLPSVHLTGSGRPVFLPGEAECFLLSSVDLESEENPNLPPFKSGLLILTTHRFIWIDESNGYGVAIPLASVVHAYPTKKSIKSMFSSPRVRIQINGHGLEIGFGSTGMITLVLRGKNDPEAFFGRVWDVMRSRAWENEVEKPGPSDSKAASGSGYGLSSGIRMAGVSGILRKEQEMWESTDKSLQDAFQDLNALMSKAKEMVMLAEKMRQRLLSGPTQDAGPNDEEMGSKQEMQDWLLSVGIVSPVTKVSAGALYHQQLARQLADFVKVPLERAGGMIALIDVYCLFNRARGTELISPEDLLQACALWEKFDVVLGESESAFDDDGSVLPFCIKIVSHDAVMLHIRTKNVILLDLIYYLNSTPNTDKWIISILPNPVMLRKFDSGVMVIQNKAHSDEEVFARIKTLVLKPDALRRGISPSDAAMTLGIAPALAKEHLLTAESKGLICRDISPEGFCFYINLFQDVDPYDIYTIKDHGLFDSWFSAITASG